MFDYYSKFSHDWIITCKDTKILERIQKALRETWPKQKKILKLTPLQLRSWSKHSRLLDLENPHHSAINESLCHLETTHSYLVRVNILSKVGLVCYFRFVSIFSAGVAFKRSVLYNGIISCKHLTNKAKSDSCELRIYMHRSVCISMTMNQYLAVRDDSSWCSCQSL